MFLTCWRHMREHSVRPCTKPARPPSLSQQLPRGSRSPQAHPHRELVGLHHLPCLFIPLQHLPWYWVYVARCCRGLRRWLLQDTRSCSHVGDSQSLPPADTPGKEGGEDVPGARAEIPLQPMEKTVVMQVVFLQPVKDHTTADIHPAAHGGLHTGAACS